MGTKGHFKYICLDCNEENWLTTKERSSHSRSHCTSCGSVYLEPVERSRVKNKMAEGRDRFAYFTEQQDKKMNK